jgi:predicted acylesterase/phospholipase RssA
MTLPFVNSAAEMLTDEIREFDFSTIGTLVLAGGGNRCWWQAGALKHLMEQGRRLPTELVGTSAGAAVATSFLVGGADTALRACLKLYAGNQKIFDWHSLPKLKLEFAHQHIYPAWVDAFLNADTFAKLHQSASRLTVALTRQTRFLGIGGSVVAGTLAYLVDKYLWNSIHPRLPRLLGLRQDVVVLNGCPDIETAQSLLIAAASAPPIMSARRVGGGYAIDGGYTDSAPIALQSEMERSNTLVMLTRYYPKLPPLFRWQGRTYWQPSERVPVSTWDCTSKATVREAYDLGVQDSARALSTGVLR